MNDLKIGIIGAGTMGNGIAQVFAAAEHQVIMHDVNDQALERGMKAIDDSLSRMLKKEKISAAEKSSILGRILTTTDLERMSDVTIVVEAASEDLEIKLTLFEQLDCICDSTAILATNTSSISLTRLAGVTKRADKVIGMHFMNPVPMMPLVELIRALQTSDQTYHKIETISTQIGKQPVEAKDSPGFVSNRILVPMINEAIFALYENLASAEGIDEIMKLGMSHPMGPLELADLIGLDICLSVMEVLHEGLGESKYRPCPLLRRMVDAGYLGRKSGRGFYQY